jgi:hypothetical protein
VRHEHRERSHIRKEAHLPTNMPHQHNSPAQRRKKGSTLLTLFTTPSTTSPLNGLNTIARYRVLVKPDVVVGTRGRSSIVAMGPRGRSSIVGVGPRGRSLADHHHGGSSWPIVRGRGGPSSPCVDGGQSSPFLDGGGGSSWPIVDGHEKRVVVTCDRHVTTTVPKCVILVGVWNPPTPAGGTGRPRVRKSQPVPIPVPTRDLNPYGFENP